MEALFLVFGDFAAGLFAPSMFVFLEAIALLPLLIQEAVAALLHLRGRAPRFVAWVRQRRPRGGKNGEAGGKTAPPWTRRILVGLLFLLLLTAGVVWALNTFFFAGTLRFLLGRAEARSGVQVSFVSASGSFFTGEFLLNGVSVKREGHASTNFDLTARSVDVAVRYRLDWGKERVIERLHVTGVGGWAEIRRGEERKPRGKPFRVDDLALTDAQVTLRTEGAHGPLEAPLRVDSWTGQGIRSGSALHAILFRCNARGSFAGNGFSLETERGEQGRVTRWKTANLPVGFLGALAGGTLAWLHEGTVDLEVEDRWKLAKKTEVEMHWNLVLNGVKAKAPAGLSPVRQALALPLVGYVNQHGKRLPLELHFILNERQFAGSASVELAAIWQGLADAAARALAAKAGIKPEEVKEAGKAGLGVLKEILDEVRKDGEPPPAAGETPQKKGLLERLKEKGGAKPRE